VKLPAGKLPPEILQKFLSSLPAGDASVMIGGGIGEDAAVLDAGGEDLLVAKTDPITFAGADAGRYLLAVNGNDLAATGAEPRWLLVTALLPEGAGEAEAEELLAGVRDACAGSGVALVGGHTEITPGVKQPILVGCLLGTVSRSGWIRTGGARPGDVILLAGGIAIEGTAILAREHAAELLARGADRETIAGAARWLDNPGISVLPAARILREIPSIHSLHDPTEGGLATALGEVAEASGAGIRLDRSAVLILPECRTICRALALDPMGLLASGALLATLDPADAEMAIERLRDAGIQGTVIGEIVAADDPRRTKLPVFARDELARYLETHQAHE